MPRLAPRVPLAAPLPLAQGMPDDGYPWAWSIYRWIDGETATRDHVGDHHHAAVVLGRFVAALRRIDPSTGPTPGLRASRRSLPLGSRDTETRAAIEALRGTIDTDRATEAWDAALSTPTWRGPELLVHGDLHPGNLLARHGRLSAVIDFGCLGLGDPAVDLMAAWTFLPAHARAGFRDEVDVDDASWARGRGWALTLGLVALPYYEHTNPAFASIARYAIDQALADHPTDLRFR